MRYDTEIPSPMGILTAVSEDDTLTGLWFGSRQISNAVVCNDTPLFDALRDWLRRYFAGEAPQIHIPLAPAGTPFQQAVWTLLRQIPYGRTVTYGDLAAKLGPRMSAQAVGQAIGHNPISILIPCHRVLGTGGKLTGYAGGLDKKRFLLELEGIPYR